MINSDRLNLCSGVPVWHLHHMLERPYWFKYSHFRSHHHYHHHLQHIYFSETTRRGYNSASLAKIKLIYSFTYSHLFVWNTLYWSVMLRKTLFILNVILWSLSKLVRHLTSVCVLLCQFRNCMLSTVGMGGMVEDETSVSTSKTEVSSVS